MIPQGNTFPRWTKAPVALILLALLVSGTLFYQKASGQEQLGQGSPSVQMQSSTATIQSLTEEERTWLGEHPVIRVVQDPGWPPVEFADERGEPSGISNEYLNLVEQRLGIKFERVRNLSWQEAYARLKQWDIDMTTSVAVTPERTGFWEFTKPYMTIPIVILTNADVTYIADMRELDGKKVGVVDGYVSNEWIQRDFPDIQLVKVRTVKEGLELLQKGEVFALVDNMLVFGYYMAKLKLFNFKVAGTTPYVNAQCMAVRKDWAILAGILQKALDAISETERAQIYQKWVPIRYEHGFDYQLLWQALAIFAVILGGLVFWNRKLSREIRYRKEAQAALRKSEKRYRDLWEKTPVMMISLDPNGRIVSVSDLFLDVLGYERDEILGRTPFEYETEESRRGATSFVFPTFMKTGLLNDVPLQFVKKNGEVIDVLLSATAERDAQGNIVRSRSVFIDVTEQKSAEKELRESEEKFSKAFQNSPDAITITKAVDGTLIDVNDAFVRISGYSREEVLGRTSVELDLWSNPEDRDRYVAALRDTGRVQGFEAPYRTQSDETRICLVSGEFIEMHGEQCILGVIHDITERKRAEEELHRVNRVLMTLSECNQALVHASDESDLLHAVCRIIVDFGGYRFAWVGLAEFDETQKVRPVAHAGREEGYLERLDVAWANKEQGWGPTGSAIRTGQPVVANDITTQPHYDLWREEALKRGFLSSIALPLKENGRVLAALNIYSDEVEAFDQEEVKLLTELADDISYGISSLRTKQKLEASEERLRLALMASQQGFYDLNVVTGNAVVSPEYAQMLGYEPSEFQETNQKWIDRLHPEDRDRIADFYRSYIAGDVKDYQVEFRQRTKYGEWKWILSFGKIVATNPDGSPLRMVGTHLDITARKLAEKELQQKTELISSVFQASPLAIIALDREGVVTMWNPAAEMMFGWTENEALGRLNPVVPEDKRLEFSGLRERVLRGESFSGVELTRRKKDGTMIVISLSTAPLKGPDGDILGILSVSADITAHKRSEEAQRRLATAIEQSIESIMMTDKDGKITYVNPSFEQISGYEKEEVLGRNTRFLKSDRHDSSHYKDFLEAIRSGNPWKGRLVSQRKDGKLIYEDVTISPVRDSSGKIVGFVDVAHDMTEHIQLEKQLIQAQKMEAIGTLAGGIAHDFNNLLQVVLGYSELMLMDDKLDSRVRDDLGKMNQAARTGADLVRSLLTFSRKTETKPRPLNLNHQIERVRKLLSRTVPRMIEIQLDLADDLASINADPTQIEQILMNLAVNARDAMPDGGKFLIETQNATLDEDYCRSHLGATPGDYVLLQFSDTGQGMDRDTLEHIFEPFYTTKGPGEGTGLGLAMVYGIVKQHYGYIMCYSELGHGTTFKVFFPALFSPSQAERAPLKRTLRGGTETILLVDDEVFIRDLGERILARAGYTVFTAVNGNEALAVYKSRQNEIALVILDLIMPEMGGKQCLEEILKICPRTKVLIASGYSANGPTKEAVGAGAKGFVTKPYDMHTMLRTVREVLDGD
jgi:PAS domain S-box-containing protein